MTPSWKEQEFKMLVDVFKLTTKSISKVETYRSSLPAPCSYMLGPASLTAPSTRACFMLAGFSMSFLVFSGMTLTSKHTTPATTGLATLVPERLLQPVLILDPIISRPYATTSGLTRPYLSSN